MNSLLTVLAASNTYDLTILATVKGELGITDQTLNDQIDAWIDQASAAIAAYCNRVFGLETVQEEFWPDRSDILTEGVAPLRLERWPVSSVTSVVEDGVTLVSGTNFRIDTKVGHLIRLDSNGWPTSWPAEAIVVVYVAGYTLLDGLPQDIERAAITMVKQAYFRARRDPSIKQESIPGVRDVSYWIATGIDAGNMTPDVVNLLAPYRVPVAV